MRYWKPKLKSGPTVGIIVASYLNEDERRSRALNCMLASVVAQTYNNWRVKVVHDGPCTASSFSQNEVIDPRIEFICTSERKLQHGHPHRREQALAPFTYRGDNPAYLATCQPDYFVFTNDDNYYMPVFLEWMLHEAKTSDSDFLYCDMIHSHRLWQHFITTPKKGRIDLGSFLVHRSLVEKVPWTDFSFSGDGTYIEALVSAAKRVRKLDATLFVHN